MKSLTNFFDSLNSNIDLDKVEDYYGHGTHQHNSQENQQQSEYQCPMKCEGNKTYPEPGNCPVCNMKLVPVNNKENMHGHHHCC